MLDTTYPDIATLRRIRSLSRFSDQQLEHLATSLQIEAADPGQCLIDLGSCDKFSLYLVFVFVPVGQLGFIITQMSQASASAGRIFEIIDTENDVADKPDAVPLKELTGHVEFEDVTFRYFGGEKPVLSEVSFKAAPGETVDGSRGDRTPYSPAISRSNPGGQSIGAPVGWLR